MRSRSPADGVRRPGAPARLPVVVRRRQARAHRDSTGRRRRVGQFRGGCAGAKNLRPPAGAPRAGRRRGRNQLAHRAAPARAGRRRHRHHEPHPCPRRNARGGGSAAGGPMGRHDRRPRLRRNRDHRDRVAGAPIITRAQLEAVQGAAPAATRCSSSTSPCRAMSIPPSATSSRSFSTTSTTCRHRRGEPLAPRRGGRARRIDRQRGSHQVHGVAALAQRRADRRRAAAALRVDPPLRVAAA